MKQYLLVAVFTTLTSINYSMNLSVNNLTLDQKIGQLFMVAAVADEEIAKDFLQQKTYRMDKEYVETLIKNYHIGGIIYLGKSDREKQKQRTKHFQSKSNIPLLIGQDLEPGRVGTSRLQPMECFFDNKTLGERNEINATYQTACAIGKYCKTLGVHINFAPVVDVNNNPNNPVINDRSFGDSPELVAAHAVAFVQGLDNVGIIACAKHFPGHGDTDVDSHKDLPYIKHDRKRLDTIELHPFKELIKNNIPAIMIAHLEVPTLENEPKLPSSLSKKIVTDLLQTELGFKGLIITDGLDMQAITNSYKNGQAELQALLSGNDILLSPVNVPAAIDAIKQAIADNRITEQEIDAHVTKILDIKNQLRSS